MKRTLPLAAAVLSAFGAAAQCVPNPQYADSVYGVWPDTTENFAHGYIGTFYSDTLQMLVPQDASLVDESAPPGLLIDSIALDSISGLPDGFYVNCNSQTGAPCTYLTGVVGCGLIEGTTNLAGTYELTIHVTAYVYVGIVVPYPVAFTGYRIVMQEPDGIPDVAVLQPLDVSAVPNPTTTATSINFGLPRAAQTRVQVFNMVGSKLWDRTVQGKAGSNSVRFDTGALENGVYLYTVDAGSNTFTGRLVVN